MNYIIIKFTKLLNIQYLKCYNNCLFRVRGLSLDLIKRRLDGNQYKRLDTFQDDLFACLERARQLSRTDSQVFEDSIELQSYFIRQRYIFIFYYFNSWMLIIIELKM